MMIDPRRALAVLVLAGSCATTAPPSPARDPKSPTIQATLERATRELYEALQNGDRAVWARWLADDFVLLDRDGTTQDRAAVLADIAPLPPHMKLGFEHAEVTVRDLGGDAAMIAFLLHEHETIFGQTIHVDYRTALTFARRPDGWKVVIFQYVELPRDGAPVAVAPDRLAAYVGEYAVNETTRFVVTLRDGKLRGRRISKASDGAEVELVPEADGVFYVPGTEFRKIFVRDARGEVVEMLDRRKGTDLRWRRSTAS